MFGSCGFLSFSSVFVSSVVGLKLRFTFISFGIWVESTRYSSACREGEDEKKAGKARRSSQLAVL